jgi:7-keto-8-aminopelargonate synthetase-like enzyme
MTPSAATAALAALRIVRDEPEHRERLWYNTHRFREGFLAAGSVIGEGQSPIKPLIVGETARTVELLSTLLRPWIYLPAIVYLVAAEGAARLRAQPSAAHSDNDIDLMVDHITRATRMPGTVR